MARYRLITTFVFGAACLFAGDAGASCVGIAFNTTDVPTLEVSPWYMRSSVTLRITVSPWTQWCAQPSARPCYHKSNSWDGLILSLQRDSESKFLMSVPSGGRTSVTFPDLANGTHRVIVGLFSGSLLLQRQILCVERPVMKRPQS